MVPLIKMPSPYLVYFTATTVTVQAPGVQQAHGSTEMAHALPRAL